MARVLGDRDLFGFSDYRIPSEPRVQHFCFFGSRECLDQFTGLAASAVLGLPSNWIAHFSPNPQDWDARTSRDQWLIFLYRVASLHPDVIPAERPLERGGETSPLGRDRGFFDPLVFAAHYHQEEKKDDDPERSSLQRWLTLLQQKGEQSPRYLYAKLALDVCNCSIAAIEWLLNMPDQWSMSNWPDGLCNYEPEDPTTEAPDDGVNPQATDYLGIKFDRQKGTVERQSHDRTVSLSPLEANLFSCLLRERGSTCPYEMLRNAWPSKIRGNRKVHTEMCRLKGKVAKIDLLIDNKRNEGYLLLSLDKLSTPAK